MAPGSTVLDVGCNAGLTSQHLLDSGAASAVTGIELYRSSVSPRLLADPGFSFLEGDLTRIELPSGFDHVVYGAVHHHVLHHYGLSEAMRCLHRIVDSCSHRLYLETGHVTEGARWPWQQSIRTLFRTDEEHLNYLLSGIEHALEDFRILGRFPIHGSRRAYLEITLLPVERRGVSRDPSTLLDIPEILQDWQGRTFGSQRQSISGLDVSRDSPTCFARYRSAELGEVFLKRQVHRPAAAHLEEKLGRQVNTPWAVRPIGMAADGRTLAFPLIDACGTLADTSFVDAAERLALSVELLDIFDQASKHRLDLPDRPLAATAAEGCTLLDVCDLNPNNLLVVGAAGDRYLRVVDFELHGTRCRARNRLNLARMLGELDTFSWRRHALQILGTMGLAIDLVVAQTVGLKRRIQERRPSLASLLIAEARTRGAGLEQRFADLRRSR